MLPISYVSFNSRNIVQQEISSAIKFMQSYDSQMLFLMQMYHRQISALLGTEPAIVLDENQVQYFPPQMKTLNAYENVYISYILGNTDLEKNCQEFFEYQAASSNVLALDVIISFYIGLASFRLYRKTRSQCWDRRSKDCKGDIELWATEGNAWNFQQKVQLLSAEDHYCSGNLEQAKELYSSAIASAKQHKYANEEALACECAAMFYLEINQRSTALEYFTMAYERYQAWGAVNKVVRLRGYVQDTFGHNIR
jgi:hypothetical protein